MVLQVTAENFDPLLLLNEYKVPKEKFATEVRGTRIYFKSIDGNSEAAGKLLSLFENEDILEANAN